MKTTSTSRRSVAAPTPPERKLRVGLVDDDAAFLYSTCFALELLGCSTRSFSSATEFLADSTISDFDCLVLDIEMPDTNGPALFWALKEKHGGFPVIFCSGLSAEEIDERGLNTGGATYLQKPIRARDLVKTIHTLCDKD